MVPLNNPAGRLYGLLGRLRALDDVSISAAWAGILDVPEDGVRERLGDVARLVYGIDAAVEGRERIEAPVNRYRTQWIEAAFPLHHNFDEPVGNIRPSEEAHEALGFVAEHLAGVAPDGKIPPEEERNELLESLHAFLAEVEADEELPPDILHLIVQRLSAVEVAIRHIEVGGPEAVRLATEALIGASATSMSRAAKAAKKALALAGVVWFAFNAGPTAQNSISGWGEIIHQLGPGSGQTSPAMDQPEPPPDELAPSPDRPAPS
jgi:hypothetical protein